MVSAIDLIYILFPLISFIFLLIGIKSGQKNYVAIALWISLISLILHYQVSGGEILGSYFNYTHALIYSINSLILLISAIYLLILYAKTSEKTGIRYLSGLIAASSIIGVLILLGNLWINAHFIEDRLAGTPILQVATFKKLDYCSYHYVFYKIGQDGKMSYMCPNYYGLLPTTGKLPSAPDYVIRQLPPSLQLKFQSPN
ncbi:MAG: type I secretion system protein LssZ [Legionella sp.]|nr:type I secretion system protein LssZ [Legionella sp.]